MRYRVMMSVVIEARDDRQAYENARNLASLLKDPMVRIAVEAKNIRLSGDGEPIVHQPQRTA